MIIKGFENEDIEVSEFGEWVGKDYIDYKSDYKEHKKIINELLKEKQELIDYLKEKITKCDKDIKIHKKEIAGVVNISENNRHILLIKRFKVEKQIYEEILSKLVEIDQIEKR